MTQFDIIFGMDWLSKYYATIDCASKQVIFRPLGQSEFYFDEKGVVSPSYLISTMKARKLINKGRKWHFCSILSVQTIDIALDNIPVVRDFSNAFPKELPGLLIDRKIKFVIDVISST
ncbi:hypothetical protein ACSBR1_004501 [Camellia fascicularis]